MTLPAFAGRAATVATNIISARHARSFRISPLAKSSEVRADVFNQRLRFLHMREMAAARKSRPALEVVITLGPLMRHQHDFLGKYCDRGRRLDDRLAMVR